MRREGRYSIEVDEEIVEIYGNLTIEEAFDFLNFFDKKGYKTLTIGSENSTLRLWKKDYAEFMKELRQEEKVEEEELYKSLYNKEELNHKQTKEKLEQVESLLRLMFTEESDKVKTLKAKIDVLEKHLKGTKLADNPEFQKILNSFTVAPPIPDSVHCIDHLCHDPLAIYRDPLEIPDAEKL